MLSSDKEHFEISLSYWCVTCDVILDNNDLTGTCKPCLKAAQAIKKSARRKTQSSSAPAKKKAPLADCEADKSRATVKAQRLECKQVEARLDQLQTEIKKDGVGVSEGLEKDILTIMGGQNLEATTEAQTRQRILDFTFLIFTFSIFTFSIFAFSIFTFSIFAFSIFTFSIFAFSIFTFSIFTFSIFHILIFTFSILFFILKLNDYANGL